MIPSPILKVLSTLATHQVRYLLMGGQACVLYGAVEFSRDIDIAIVADDENLTALEAAVSALHARCIAVPTFRMEHLLRGHAVRFRCYRDDVHGLRIDVMTTMRGVASFEELWGRRSDYVAADGQIVDVIGLEDLVRAKKTQRAKDWPMIQRLVERHFIMHRTAPTRDQIEFWFREARSPFIMLDLAKSHLQACQPMAATRPLLAFAAAGDADGLERALLEEQ